MDERSVVSDEFPYIPIRILLNGWETEAEALLGTGFSGEVIVPEDAVPDDIGPPAYFVTYRVADNRVVSSPVFYGDQDGQQHTTQSEREQDTVPHTHLLDVWTRLARLYSLA